MHRLTPRQREFLDLKCKEGLTSQQIAERCFIECPTAALTLMLAYKRLGLTGRAKEATACYQLGRADARAEMLLTTPANSTLA